MAKSYNAMIIWVILIWHIFFPVCFWLVVSGSIICFTTLLQEATNKLKREPVGCSLIWYINIQSKFRQMSSINHWPIQQARIVIIWTRKRFKDNSEAEHLTRSPRRLSYKLMCSTLNWQSFQSSARFAA